MIRWKELGAIITEVATLNWGKITDIQEEADAEIKESVNSAARSIQGYQNQFDKLQESAMKAADAILTADRAAENEPAARPVNRTGPTGGGKDNSDSLFLNDAKEHLKDIESEEQATKIATQQMTKHYEDMFAPIDRGFNTMVTGILSGTQTWQQAMSRAVSNMLIAFLEADAKMLEKHIASELAKTEATEAGNSVRTTSDLAADTASGGFSAAKYISEIEGDAAKTYASVFAWASPELGPFAAAPAAAAAALVGAQAALVPSFDVGTNYVPQTGLALIHQGEQIIPAAQNRNSGGGGDTYVINISAMDAQSVTNLLKNNSSVINGIVASGMRNGNPALRPQ